MNYIYGVDVGGTTVKLGLFQEDGSLIEKWEIPTRKEDGGAHIIEDILYSIGKSGNPCGRKSCSGRCRKRQL